MYDRIQVWKQIIAPRIEETTPEEIKDTTCIIIANKDSRFIAFHNNGHLGSWGFVTKKITPNVDQPTRGDFIGLKGV